MLGCEADSVSIDRTSQDATPVEDNNSLFKTLEDLITPTPKPPISIGDPVVVDQDDNYEYLEQLTEEADAIPEVNLLDSKSDIFYPGALFDGQSVLDARYEPIVVPRNKITISTSLNGSGNVVTTEVENPKLSTVRQAVNKLITQDFDVPPANMSYDISEVHDENQLRIALGAAYEGGIGSIKGSFDFSKRSKVSRTVFKFKQIYYTLDLDLPKTPADFFTSPLESSIFKGKTPVYVSSVTYGRQIYLMVESSMSALEVKASLQGMFSSSVGQFSASAEAEFNKLSSKSSIKSVVVGGGAGSAASNIGSLADLKTLVSDGGKFGKSNPGVAISYTLRTLKENKKFVTVLGAKFKKAIARPRKPKAFNCVVRLNKVEDTFGYEIGCSPFALDKFIGSELVSTKDTDVRKNEYLLNVSYENGKIVFRSKSVFITGKLTFSIDNEELFKKYYETKSGAVFPDPGIQVKGSYNGGLSSYSAYITVLNYEPIYE